MWVGSFWEPGDGTRLLREVPKTRRKNGRKILEKYKKDDQDKRRKIRKMTLQTFWNKSKD